MWLRGGIAQGNSCLPADDAFSWVGHGCLQESLLEASSPSFVTRRFPKTLSRMITATRLHLAMCSLPIVEHFLEACIQEGAHGFVE